jgi:hypothetical protein
MYRDTVVTSYSCLFVRELLAIDFTINSLPANAQQACGFGLIPAGFI